ncbi:MAG: YebC/PmpR family DNA-binding transcriptional regulator [Planctomycetes bacterium]|nr:YebC/PmpR family DNA-binding transcriptional regulator [Planctomycetota bacterium]
MSGHSHWATIKHKKTAQDAKKGKVFSKLGRLLEVAAREGGPDIDHNPRLREIIEKAKGSEMPKDNIERAIKKGAGLLEGTKFESVTYEGYGPNGVAILVEALTDNRNRTSNEMRILFERNNGNLAGAGAVSYQFKRKGTIRIEKSGVTEQQLFDEVIEHEVEDISESDDGFEIICPVNKFQPIQQALKKYKILSAEITLIPDNFVKVDETIAKKIVNLLSTIEDHDDTQNVYSNCDFPAGFTAE